MLSNKEKIGFVAKLSMLDLLGRVGKRDNAKRERATLSSLPLRIRWSRAWWCMPSVALGGDGVLRLLRSTCCPGDEAKTHWCNGPDYELRNGSEALSAYVQRKMGTRFNAIAHS
jgi:hypothetical protein